MRKAIFLLLLSLSSYVNANFVMNVPTEQEINCLAENLYHETKGESRYGTLAVANVTINRMKSSQFPRTVCGVVKQRNSNGCQFSWVCANKRITDVKRYNQMKILSEQILRGKVKMDVISSDVLWFHNKHVQPYWTRYGVFAGRIGSHLFYKRVKR